jgi:hypothetical protein
MSTIKQKSGSAYHQSETFNPTDYEFGDASNNPPDLDQFYGTLENYVRMVTGDYSNMLMLDAKGGLGKTYNVKRVLDADMHEDKWTHMKGFTTPVELYKTLWSAQDDGHILFLDDMSGVTGNTKAIDMLKAATDTNGDENWVEYRTSRAIEHPEKPEEELPKTFCFRGRVIMSFNDTPDNEHFNALKDRGTFYQLNFTYKERLSLVREIAKLQGFSDLTVTEQQETAEWVASVSNSSMDVSLRTFQNICQMRYFGQETGESWERMAMGVFDIDHEKYIIIQMREADRLSVEEQVEYFKQETGRSESHYYNLLSEIRSDRM